MFGRANEKRVGEEKEHGVAIATAAFDPVCVLHLTTTELSFPS